MHDFQLLIYIAFYLHTFLHVHCEEVDIIDDVTLPTPELKNIYSFFYMSSEKEDKDTSSSVATKNEQSLTMTQPSSFRELDERSTQDAIFYKRLITILLSNLAMQKIDDRLIGTLNIDLSSSQFEYLQNFINGQGSIREVDRILDNAIKQSDYSARHYIVEAFYYFDLFTSKALQYLIYCLSFMKEHWDITIISFMVVVCFMILKRQRWSRGLLIFLTIDVIFVISFFITWWRLIQEAEIKLMAQQAQFAEMPITCQPHKMGLWDKMVASFSSTNDCEKYYETIMTNPRLQVTPAFALTYFLSTVIFQPISYFGVVISEFVDNATGKLNIFLKLPVVYALFFSFCVCIVLIPFTFIGGYINFGFGPFFNVGLKGRQNSNKKPERIERIYEETSSRKRLKDSEKMKQITLKENNDFAGDNAGDDKQHLREKRIKYKSENESGNGDVDGDEECEVENN